MLAVSTEVQAAEAVIAALGPYYFYKFDDGTGSQLTDYSSNARHATLDLTAGETPTWVGHPSISFDGGDNIQTPISDSPTTFELFLVVLGDAGCQDFGMPLALFGDDNFDNNCMIQLFRQASPAIDVTYRTKGGSSHNGSADVFDDGWHLINVWTPTASTLSATVDGAADVTAQSITELTTTSGEPGGIGARNAGGSTQLGFTGSIAYLVLFDGALSSGNRAAVRSALITIMAARGIFLPGATQELFDTYNQPVNFDGTSDRLSTALVASDSKVWSGSCWIRVVGSGTLQYIAQSTGSAIAISYSGATGNLAMLAENSAGTGILSALLNSALVAGSGWHHLLWSIDLADSGNRSIYVDDVNVTGDVTWSTYTDDTIDFTVASTSIGGQVNNTNFVAGDMGPFWMKAGGSYIDFTTEANRRDFITSDGKPTVPTEYPSRGDIELHGRTDSWHLNQGTGGGFTENGALTDGTGPIEIAYSQDDAYADIAALAPVGEFRFDEGTDVTLTDHGSVGADMTITGSGGSWVQGGYDFGTSAYATVTNVFGITGADPRTVIYVANPQGLTTTGPSVEWPGTGVNGDRWTIRSVAVGSNLRLEISGSGFTETALTNLANDTESFIACSQGAGGTLANADLYHNGETQACTGANTVATAGTTFIVNRANNADQDGIYRYLLIFDYELTPTQIATCRTALTKIMGGRGITLP